MRPIFCGNLEFDSRQNDLERLFRRYGKVEMVDMKSGYAFVYMGDERDAEYAIRRLDRTEFGRKGYRLQVEWTKQERGRGLEIQDLQLTLDHQKHCLSLIFIQFIPGQEIWRGTLTNMGKY